MKILLRLMVVVIFISGITRIANAEFKYYEKFDKNAAHLFI